MHTRDETLPRHYPPPEGMAGWREQSGCRQRMPATTMGLARCRWHGMPWRVSLVHKNYMSPTLAIRAMCSDHACEVVNLVEYDPATEAQMALATENANG